MTTTTTPTAGGRDYVYALQRRLYREQLERDRAAVEAQAVHLGVNALRHGGVLGGVRGAQEIEHEAAGELEEIDRKIAALDELDTVDEPEPGPDPFDEAIALTADGARVGGWVPEVPPKLRVGGGSDAR